jgi:hypothetical protein
MFEVSNPYWFSNPTNQGYVINLVNDFWVSQPTGQFQDLYIHYRRSGTNLSNGASMNGVTVPVYFPVRQQSGAKRPLYATVQYRASHPNVRYVIYGCCGGASWTWTANSFNPPYIGGGMWQGWVNIPSSVNYQNTSFTISYSSGAIPLNADWWIEMFIHLSANPVTDPYTPTSTPTVTPTETPTDTPTPTFTPTHTNTPTFIPTNTFIPGTPHSNGSGTCWSSQESWATDTVYYDISTSSIPGNITEADWVSSIEAAVHTWTNVTPSNFTFVRQVGSSNTVRFEVPNDESKLAASAPAPSSGFITSGYTKINPNYLWDVNNTPIPGNPGNNGSSITYNLQNVVTHELGHWLYLNDINDSNCRDVTMDYSSGHGELIEART